MTQIVYTGRHLIADRRCFLGNETSFDQVKLRSLKQDGKTLHFAFCGSYLACELGEKLIRSNFDQAVKDEIISRLGDEANLVCEPGILIETPDNPDEPTRTFFVSYAGDKAEFPTNTVMVVGALNDRVKSAMDVYGWAINREGGMDWTKQTPTLVAGLIRFVLKDTSYNQEGHLFDYVDTWERGDVRYKAM